MKEQILQLEPHDDFNSTRDKMGWAQATRVLLVWPDRGRILARRIDLLLLHRHANRLGAHLALITTDQLVREHAADLGLPVFGSLDESRRVVWRSRRVRPTRQRLHARPDPAAVRESERLHRKAAPAWVAWALRGLVFAIGLGGVAALAIVILPSATITLRPSQQAQVAQLSLTADPAQGTIAGSQIPARLIRVELQAQGATATTGLRGVPSAAAAGTVVFTSLDGIGTVVPQGTGVRTTSGVPIRFRTTRTITVEPRVGATESVAVAAVELGPASNVGAGQINAIDGPLGLQFAVTNLEPTRGGANTDRASVTTADRARLRTELMDRLSAEALPAIESLLTPGEFLAVSSVRVAEVVAITYDLAVGEQADTVGLTLRIAAIGVAVHENDARLAAQVALLSSLPAGQMLVPGSERFERDANDLTLPDGRVQFDVAARGASVATVQQSAIREMAAGQLPPQTQLLLARQLPLTGLPDIAIQPDWYPRMPSLPFRIHVAVVQGQ